MKIGLNVVAYGVLAVTTSIWRFPLKKASVNFWNIKKLTLTLYGKALRN